MVISGTFVWSDGFHRFRGLLHVNRPDSALQTVKCVWLQAVWNRNILLLLHRCGGLSLFHSSLHSRESEQVLLHYGGVFLGSSGCLSNWAFWAVWASWHSEPDKSRDDSEWSCQGLHSMLRGAICSQERAKCFQRSPRISRKKGSNDCNFFFWNCSWFDPSYYVCPIQSLQLQNYSQRGGSVIHSQRFCFLDSLSDK